MKKIFNITMSLVILSTTLMLVSAQVPISNITPMPPIMPYNFNVDMQYTFIKSGEIAQYLLTINNNDNIMDTYGLTIDPNNIGASLSKDNISIDARAAKSVYLNVTGSVTGTYIVNVTVHSQSNLLAKTITTNTYVDLANITEFNIENYSLNGFTKADVTVENHDNQSHWFVVVVNGTVNSTIKNGTNIYPIVGTGIVRLDAKQSVKVPVLVSISPALIIPSEFISDRYEAYAELYSYDDYVLDQQRLIDRSVPIDLITVKGHVRYTNIEGGCTYLEGDDGKTYELYNGTLPPIGTYILVEGKIRTNMASICMIGQILEVISIKEIKL